MAFEALSGDVSKVKGMCEVASRIVKCKDAEGRTVSESKVPEKEAEEVKEDEVQEEKAEEKG